MLYKKDINKELEQLSGLKELVQVYGEVASIRMKKIREFVLNNRQFLESIHDIFKDVLSTYAKKLTMMMTTGKIPKGEKVTFLAHNGKTVAVLISANTGFYGSVVQNVFNRFVEDVRKENYEVTIVGRLGLSLYLGNEQGRPYTYFSLPDYGVDQQKLSELIRHLVQYEEIRIYYGKYLSVVTQKPDKYVISAGTKLMQPGEASGKEYIIEPSIEKILGFFETEIFASLFDQTIRESQLAKFASRILAMDSAEVNIRKKLAEVELEKLKLEHKIINQKMLNSMSAVFYNH
jgi:F0F1-type ATP synthase gamma subunit